MLKSILLLLMIPQVFSTNETILSISENPLFTKIFGLIDQLLTQVRKMESLINRVHNMMDQMPVNIRPYFTGCFTVTHNITSAEYSSKLEEVEITRIPQIKDQLKQAKTLEQQLKAMNMTDRMVKDITLNMIKPSLAFVNGIVDCLKSKY